MTAPFYTNRCQVAAAVESTEGTAETLVNGDVIHPVWDVSWSPTVEMGDRKPISASHSQEQQVPGKRTVSVSFKTELKGSGTAGTPPPNLDVLFKACGLAVANVPATSDTYAPASESVPSLTIEVREGSYDDTFKIKRIVGARGTFKFDASSGTITTVEFSFMGVYVEPSDGSALTTPSDAVVPVGFLSTAMNFHALGAGALRVDKCTFDLGNTLAPRPDCTKAAGVLSYVITGRNPVATIDPEQDITSVVNFFNRWTAATTGAFTYTLGSTGGNIVTVTFAKVQITNVPEGDREGIRIVTLNLKLLKSAAAGDDEFSIVFT